MTTAQETPDSDRLSRLEVTVDYLVREVGDIKADLRQMRTDSGEQNRALREALDRNRQELQEAIDQEPTGVAARLPRTGRHYCGDDGGHLGTHWDCPGDQFVEARRMVGCGVVAAYRRLRVSYDDHTRDAR